MSLIPTDILTRLKAIVGPAGYIEDPADMEPYCVSWRDGWRGDTPLVLRPASTQEVSEIVALCAKAGIPIVPQGGNTGLTGAGQPHAGGSEIVLSTNRMKAIREVDALNDTMTVEAGVVLTTIQDKAAELDRLFPL
ncbi:MAG: FAD-binding oxidoreductase, partial [Alphaproteobacteria bacterium]|nr:FAD-binding oxidoreductase [Alphaproteobacteria bacterium]